MKCKLLFIFLYTNLLVAFPILFRKNYTTYFDMEFSSGECFHMDYEASLNFYGLGLKFNYVPIDPFGYVFFSDLAYKSGKQMPFTFESFRIDTQENVRMPTPDQIGIDATSETGVNYSELMFIIGAGYFNNIKNSRNKFAISGNIGLIVSKFSSLFDDYANNLAGIDVGFKKQSLSPWMSNIIRDILVGIKFELFFIKNNIRYLPEFNLLYIVNGITVIKSKSHTGSAAKFLEEFYLDISASPELENNPFIEQMKKSDIVANDITLNRENTFVFIGKCTFSSSLLENISIYISPFIEFIQRHWQVSDNKIVGSSAFRYLKGNIENVTIIGMNIGISILNH